MNRLNLLGIAALLVATVLLAACSTPLPSLPSVADAIKTGKPDVVKRYVDGGGNPNEMVEGTPLLMQAILNNQHGAAEMLVQKGADPNARDGKGVTPLYAAISAKDMQLVALLLDKGADVNAKVVLGFTALHLAATKGDKGITALLLERGADVNARDDNGITPLHRTAADGHYDAGVLLLDKGADFKAADSEGVLPIHWACAKPVSAKLAAAIIERGADVNAKDNQGRTPLHWAAKYNCVDGVKLLLEKKADPALTDAEGGTAAQVADANGSKDVLALLQPPSQ